VSRRERIQFACGSSCLQGRVGHVQRFELINSSTHHGPCADQRPPPRLGDPQRQLPSSRGRRGCAAASRSGEPGADSGAASAPKRGSSSRLVLRRDDVWFPDKGQFPKWGLTAYGGTSTSVPIKRINACCSIALNCSAAGQAALDCPFRQRPCKPRAPSESRGSRRCHRSGRR
jgi:hypothetical protein